MTNRLAVFIAGLAVTLAVAGVATAAPKVPELSTTLTGANVSPGPGDPDGTGAAIFQLNRVEQRVCFQITWANVDGEVVAGDIHVARVGEPGPVVLDLFDNSSGSQTPGGPIGCVQGVDPALITAIAKHPSRYYLDLHSTVYILGAVRGQLSK